MRAGSSHYCHIEASDVGQQALVPQRDRLNALSLLTQIAGARYDWLVATPTFATPVDEYGTPKPGAPEEYTGYAFHFHRTIAGVDRVASIVMAPPLLATVERQPAMLATVLTKIDRAFLAVEPQTPAHQREVVGRSAAMAAAEARSERVAKTMHSHVAHWQAYNHQQDESAEDTQDTERSR